MNIALHTMINIGAEPFHHLSCVKVNLLIADDTKQEGHFEMEQIQRFEWESFFKKQRE